MLRQFGSFEIVMFCPQQTLMGNFSQVLTAHTHTHTHTHRADNLNNGNDPFLVENQNKTRFVGWAMVRLVYQQRTLFLWLNQMQSDFLTRNT